jgi:hypothetical protein
MFGYKAKQLPALSLNNVSYIIAKNNNTDLQILYIAKTINNNSKV